MNFLSEAFKGLQSLNEETFDISVTGENDELKDFLDKDDELDVLTVIDDEAETEDELKDSYIGKVILDCNVCHSLIYKDADEVKLGEDGEVANEDEECPFCYSVDGFKIIGQVKPFTKDDEEVEDEEIEDKEVEDNVEEDNTEIEVEDEEKLESLRHRSNLREARLNHRSHKRLKELLNANVNLDASGQTIGLGFGGGTGISQGTPGGLNLPGIGEELEDDVCPECGKKHCECEDNLEECGVKEDLGLGAGIALAGAGIGAGLLGSKLVDSYDECEEDEEDEEDVLEEDYIAEANDLSAVDKYLWKLFSKAKQVTLKDAIRNKNFIAMQQGREVRVVYAGNLDPKHIQDMANKAKKNNTQYVLKANDVITNDDVKIDDARLEKGVRVLPVKDLSSFLEKVKKFKTKEDNADNTKKKTVRVAVEDVKDGDILNYDGDIVEVASRAEKGPDNMLHLRVNGIGKKNRIVKNGDQKLLTIAPKAILNKVVRAKITSDGGGVSFRESIEDMSIKTDDGTELEMTSGENGEVTITTRPGNTEEVVEDTFENEEVTEEPEETIGEIDTETEDEIVNNGEEGEAEEAEEETAEEGETEGEDEVEVDEFDEETFESLGESYLKKVYSNVNSFKVSKVYESNSNRLFVEGLITFNSGNVKKTSFVFKNCGVSKTGKTVFEGYNKEITRSNKSFTLKGRVDGKKIFSESLSYRYNQNKKRINGIVK